MSILTGNVIKDEVEAVVKLKLFWISKIIFYGRLVNIPMRAAPDPEKVLVEKSRLAIKRVAIETNASTNNIIAANIAGVTDNVLAKLPRMETMRRDVRIQLATHAAHPPVPDDGDTLFDIPQRFTVTSTGDEFLKYYNQRAEKIFGTGRSLNFLQNSDNWFMDETLLIVPPQFAQLYTVHGLSHGRHIAGAYGLLQIKGWNLQRIFDAN